MGHPLNPIGCLFLTLTEACRLEEENCLEISGIKCSSWILSWQLWLRWVQIWGSGHLDSESPLSALAGAPGQSCSADKEGSE